MEKPSNGDKDALTQIFLRHDIAIQQLSVQLVAFSNVIAGNFNRIQAEINHLGTRIDLIEGAVTLLQQRPLPAPQPQKPEAGLEFHGPKFIHPTNQKRKAAAMQPQNPRIVHTAPSKDVEKSMQDFAKRIKNNLNITEQALQTKRSDNEKDSRHKIKQLSIFSFLALISWFMPIISMNHTCHCKKTDSFSP